MAANCSCGKLLLEAIGSSNEAGTSRFEKTSLRDKEGIASLIGKSEQYSIRHSPRIHLNRPQHQLQEIREFKPIKLQPKESAQRFLNVPQSPREYNHALTRVTSLEPYKMATVLSPRYRPSQNISTVNPVYVVPNRKEFKQKITVEQPKSAQLQRSKQIQGKRLQSTNCETPTQSTFPMQRSFQPTHRRSQTLHYLPKLEMSEISSPIGTPRNNQHPLRQQLHFIQGFETEDESLIDAIKPQDLEILGQLNPKFAVSTHDDSQQQSMLSGRSEVVERRSPMLLSQIFMNKKLSQL